MVLLKLNAAILTKLNSNKQHIHKYLKIVQFQLNEVRIYACTSDLPRSIRNKELCMYLPHLYCPEVLTKFM